MKLSFPRLVAQLCALALVSLASTAALAQAHEQCDVALDGEFEDPPTNRLSAFQGNDDWTSTAGAFVSRGYGAPAFSGDQSLLVSTGYNWRTRTTQSGSVSHVLSTVPGETYTVTFAARGYRWAPPSWNTLAVDWNDDSHSLAPSTRWQSYSFTFVADSDVAELTLRSLRQMAFIDAVSISGPCDAG